MSRYSGEIELSFHKIFRSLFHTTASDIAVGSCPQTFCKPKAGSRHDLRTEPSCQYVIAAIVLLRRARQYRGETLASNTIEICLLVATDPTAGCWIAHGSSLLGTFSCLSRRWIGAWPSLSARLGWQGQNQERSEQNIFHNESSKTLIRKYPSSVRPHNPSGSNL
jgi:hypothetical protein